MLKRLLLRGENKGIGAVEFALIAPVLIAFVVGISQMGKLFFANADMKNAMAHGARAASVYPVPEDDATIKAVVNERLARTGGVAKAKVEIKRGVENGNNFLDIEMTYQVPLDFIVYDMAPVTLKDTRRVYTQMAPRSTDGSTSTTSTSATSAGGTTSSTSATSASSTGGTTSATSASSTTSSTTSASTTSSSGNGNSNGNSSHGHGDCKKKC
ncbi:MAG TPA: TadE family protein [Allosphingosinicella sp.]